MVAEHFSVHIKKQGKYEEEPPQSYEHIMDGSRVDLNAQLRLNVISKNVFEH